MKHVNINLSKMLIIGALPLMSAVVFAADVSTETQRDVNQESRIEQGLKSGELNTREAAKLEKQEGRVDAMQAKALKDGTLSPEEQARIKKAQDHTSKEIYEQKHDAQQGNPDSASSKRMQADVQRNVNQEARIHEGVDTGALNNKEVATLQAGQAVTDRKEARAGADGHVSKTEKRHIQHTENHQSKKIHHEKHDNQ